jgi:hypothetical protein
MKSEEALRKNSRGSFEKSLRHLRKLIRDDDDRDSAASIVVL